MDKKLTWVEIILLLACFAATFTAIVMVLIHFTHDIEKEKIGDAATWFGAIGTVFAFFAVIGVAFWTWQNGQIDKLNEREVVAQAILVICYDFRYQLTGYLRKLRHPTRSNDAHQPADISKLFSDHSAWLTQIQLHQQPTHEHVYCLMTIIRTIESTRYTIDFVADIFSRWDEQGQSYEFADLKKADLLRQADGIVDDASKMVQLLGRTPHSEPEYLASLRKLSEWGPWR